MIACGCGAKRDDYPWHREVLDNFKTTRSPRKTVAGMALHYYTNDPENCPDPAKFGLQEWDHLIGIAKGMEEAIVRLWGMALGSKQENIGLLAVDEWGTWYNPGDMNKDHLWRQQSYQLDAAVAGLTFNIFNNHCDKILLATIAQLCNCDQALFLAEGEQCILTPTYHVFEMYKGHQNGQTIRSLCDGKKLSVSASVKDNVLTATVVNLSGQEDVSVQLDPLGGSFRGAAKIRILGNGDLKAHNTFEDPHRLEPAEYTVEHFDGTLTLPRGAVAAVSVACD
jgi:alpha-N-arabinofuranosidase